MIVKAWAVVCKSGEVHRWSVYADRATAREWRSDMNSHGQFYRCGPHRVITLRGEMVAR